LSINAGTFPRESSPPIAGIFGQKSRHTEGKHNVQKHSLPGKNCIFPEAGGRIWRVTNCPASLQY